MRVLITGSRGLVGRSLARALTDVGIDVVTFDIRDDPEQDVRRGSALASALRGVDGVVHLAAISRVAWGERHPNLCRQINEQAFSTLVSLCEAERPWLVFSSSREVYGHQDGIPVSESAALNPVNTYARSKAFGEGLIARLREQGSTANIVRLSNVYGEVDDHADRVIPAFARAAATGGTIRVEGGSNIFDFTHVSDVTSGLIRLIELTAQGRQLDPIHLASGIGTTLDDLAQLATAHARIPITVEARPVRTFDMGSFVGTTTRSREVLSWSARTPIQQGFADLVDSFASGSCASEFENWLEMLEMPDLTVDMP